MAWQQLQRLVVHLLQLRNRFSTVLFGHAAQRRHAAIDRRHDLVASRGAAFGEILDADRIADIEQHAAAAAILNSR